MTGERIDIHDHTMARRIREAEERAEADNASMVVPNSRRVETHYRFWQRVERGDRQPLHFAGRGVATGPATCRP